MSEIKCILFDCMETVVDVMKIPDIRMYSSFAYYGSGYEYLWQSFESFIEDYNYARLMLEKGGLEHREYNLFDRFDFMVRQKKISKGESMKAVAALSNNYWENYKANCYVHDDVKAVLSDLHLRYRCGIVSNFMVDGGIEELLNIHGIDKFFDFVVTSIKVGWRKPHKEIYDMAYNMSTVSKNQILFVGDDHICDYVGSLNYGFNAALLDKKNENGEFQSLGELIRKTGVL